MASSISRISARRLAQLNSLRRSFHVSPDPFAATAVRAAPAAKPATNPSATAQSASSARDDFESVMDEFAPSRPSSSASKSTHSNGQVSPPLKTVPGENSDPLPEVHSDNGTDWTTSFSGIGSAAYPRETIDRLLKPLNPSDIEIKPDGMIYLPEIKYRRVLNQAFGPGGWGMVPRGQTNVSDKLVSREWALVCMGRIAAIARGEQQLYEAIGVPTATEAAKSNALMRCCKDLGIASELWDPQFIRDFKKQYAVEVFAEHVVTKKKKKLWRLKREPKLDYPWKE